MRFLRVLTALTICLVATLLHARADADGSRVLTFRYTPTARAQIALWVETDDGDFMGTIRLTEATARRGIGNRPGSLQMNSGFRWPYGRREGTLPIWAHRRATAPGAQPFPRVIFQNRLSEGFASRTSNDQSRDDYFCLSFDRDTTTREALDAITCASVFNSDKGRYITQGDVDGGYLEPYFDVGESPTESLTRPLSMTSLYPPRRDVDGDGANDHSDVASFNTMARSVMPDIDAVTMATPAGDALQAIQFVLPDDWPDGVYVAYLEVNVEGDYNDHHDDGTYPKPLNTQYYDTWARNYGYPYRGQPSVLYRVPFNVQPGGGRYVSLVPDGYGDIHGNTGDITPMDGTISDDHGSSPGSGADRLIEFSDEGSPARLSVEVVTTDVCGGVDPPPECFIECDQLRPCPTGFTCDTDGQCTGICEVSWPAVAAEDLEIINVDDVKQAHHWGRIQFTAPSRAAGEPQIVNYVVRVSDTPIETEDDFMQAVPAKGATLDDVSLEICPAGECPEGVIDIGIGHLQPQTTHYVGIQAVDQCGVNGPITVAEITTTPIHFTTVSPCFVATAAYGTPMAEEIRLLRRFRDRHLRPHPIGAAFVEAYYQYGPDAAAFIRERPWARSAVRSVLAPVLDMLQDTP